MYCDDYVVLAFLSLGFIVLLVFGSCLFGGPDALELAMYLSLLVLLGLRGTLIDLFDVDEGPGEVVLSADGLDACALCWETCRGMEILDGRLDAWDLIDMVD